MDVEIEIPLYFLCPISLQIMKDPVTAITGITYDRESIEHWLKKSKDTPNCPVTKQPLPKHSDLTPNHTLRRLIQAWCTSNAANGVDLVPTPRAPLCKKQLRKLIMDLDLSLNSCSKAAMESMESLAVESERNRQCMVEVGVEKAMISWITRCFNQCETVGLEQALRILYLVSNSSEQIKSLTKDNQDFMNSIIWILGLDLDNHVLVKTTTMSILHRSISACSASFLERLKLDFFKGIVRILKEKVSQQATKSAILVLIEACPWGRNRTRIVESNAVFELIELELQKPERQITELIFHLLSKLCSCADGRAQFLKHAGSIAMLAKRTLRVSPATDDRAVHILGLIARFSATDEVLVEMLRVGAVSKLCMVIQADCAAYLKEKARDILRLHSNVWNNSPCIAVYLLTRYPR